MVHQKRKHTADFKSRVAFEALREQQTIGELASRYQIHPTQIRRWRDILKEKLSTVFSDKSGKELASKNQLIDRLYRQVGQLTIELNWLKKKMGLASD